MYFFDWLGKLHETCKANMVGAQVGEFGPTGVSRLLLGEQATAYTGLHPQPGETLYGCAKRTGRLLRGSPFDKLEPWDWDILLPPAFALEEPE